VNYVLQRSRHATPFVVHADKLKKCWTEAPSSWLSDDQQPANVESSDFSVEGANHGMDEAEELPQRGPEESLGRMLPSPFPNAGVVDDSFHSLPQSDETVIQGRERRANRRRPRHLQDFMC